MHIFTLSFSGSDCSEIPTCYNVANCSGQGLCVDTDLCKCEEGWTGIYCTEPSCEEVAYCSGHGQCVALRTCLCDDGWTGPSCSTPDCTEVKDCSGQGICVAPNECDCILGTEGEDCSIITNCPSFDNCNHRGLCLVGRETVDGPSEKGCR